MHNTTAAWRTLFDRLYLGLDARVLVEQVLNDLEDARALAALRLQRLRHAYPLLGVGDYVIAEEETREPDGTTYTDRDTGEVLCAACHEPAGQHLLGCVHMP